MHKAKLAFIGAGNIAGALIGGLIKDGYDPKKIWATNPDLVRLEALKKELKIHITIDNKEAAEQADVIVLAVKPNLLELVAGELAEIIQRRKLLVISVAAMITETLLSRWLGDKVAIVRCMPNTPALVGCGATGLYANANVNQEQKELAESIMRAVGLTVFVNSDKEIDVVTAISGCGPAYFFLFIEAMQQAGEKFGLAAETAKILALQTALGAARLAMESEVDVIALRKQVASKGGSTEKAIEVFEERKLRDIVFAAMNAAKKRAGEILGSV